METKNLQDDATVIDESVQTSVSTETNRDGGKSSKFSASSVAAGAGFGILLGSTATFLSTCSIDAVAAEVTTEEESASEVQPEWSDGNVGIASTVNDEMSFSEAFAAARAEVGPGGAFEWRGNVYGTYTAEEWNDMTPDQRHEYQDHFAWSSAGGSAAETTVTPEEPAPDLVADNIAPHQGDVEHGTSDTQPFTDDVEVVDASEVEIIGVVHDDESGVDFGVMNVDGQEVILADVDNDGEFDIMAADVNSDGVIAENEVVSVEDQHIQVSDFASNSVGTDSMYAMNDGTPDYVNDADVSGYENLA